MDSQTIINVQAGIISDKEHQHPENGTEIANAYVESDEADVLIEDLSRKSDINLDELSLR